VRVTSWKLGLTAAVAGLSTLLATGPAQAAYSINSDAYSSSFVDGDGTLTDDWGEQFGELGNSLCYGCGNSNNTDIVVLWQSILAAEELLTLGDIDGQFGPKTRDATIAWQKRYELSADGKVGDATWGKADDRLSWQTNSMAGYTASYQSGAVMFYRGDTSKYRDGGAYKLYRVYRHDHARDFGGYRIQFGSLTVL
jgi:peptidoglycan hydrolase-like protein with peptidoglycan-binding domain